MIIQKSGKYIWQYGKLVSGHVLLMTIWKTCMWTCFTNDYMENLYAGMFY